MPEQPPHQPQDDAGDALPSKSERKRQMHALQALGEALLALNDEQLAAVPVRDEQLLEALRDCRRIRSNSARKRQLQYIGKLMRGVDADAIEQALARLHEGRREAAQAFHELENLRDEVLAGGPAGVDIALAQFPHADRQQLRQLVLQHQRELQRGKPPAASRKLFRYLRALQEERA